MGGIVGPVMEKDTAFAGGMRGWIVLDAAERDKQFARRVMVVDICHVITATGMGLLIA